MMLRAVGPLGGSQCISAKPATEGGGAGDWVATELVQVETNETGDRKYMAHTRNAGKCISRSPRAVAPVCILEGVVACECV